MPRDDFEEFDGEPLDPHSAELQRALVTLHDAEDDDEGFAPDVDDSRALAVVKEREGRELVSDATDPARERREIEAEQDEDEGDEPELPAVAEKQEREPKAKESAPVPAVAGDTEALLAAIPEAQRDQVKALAERAEHWSEIERIVEPFMETLKQNGETPIDGIRTLAEINTFATQRPGEYMAWFTSKFVPPENRAKALIQLGQSIGVKLVEDEFGLDEDEGDAAEKPQPVDPEVLRQQHAANTLISSFEGAKGADGAPAHPLFQSAHPLSGAVHRSMTQAIAADVAAGKPRPATVAQMRGYYDAAVEQITAALPGNKTAQEKVDKARRASSPVSSSRTPPRRSSTNSRPRSDDGADELLDGIKALFGSGDEG